MLILSLKRRYNYLAREREKNLVVSGGRVEGSWKERGTLAEGSRTLV